VRRVIVLAAFILIVAGCGDDDALFTTTSTAVDTTTIAPATTTTTVPPSTTTTTVPPSTTTTTHSPAAALPDEPMVDSLAWSGSFVLDVTGDQATTLSGTLTGAYLAPDHHEVVVSGEAIETGSDGTSTVESVVFRAVAVGDEAIIEEDGTIVNEDLEDEVNDHFGVMSTAGGAIIPTAGMLATLRATEAESRVEGGVAVNVYVLEEEYAFEFVPLFGYSISDLGGFAPLSIRLVVDTATGAVLQGSLAGESQIGDGGLTLELEFRVDAINDPGIEIEAATDDVTALTRYEDPEGRFIIDYPADWDVRESEEFVNFESPVISGLFAGVSLGEDVLEPGATIDDYLDYLLEEAPDSVVFADDYEVEQGGLVWRFVDLRFEDGDGTAVRALLGVTVADGAGYGFILSVPETLYVVAGAADLAEAMFSSLVITAGYTGSSE